MASGPDEQLPRHHSDAENPARTLTSGTHGGVAPVAVVADDGLDWDAALNDALSAVEKIGRGPDAVAEAPRAVPQASPELLQQVEQLTQEVATLRDSLARSQTEFAQAHANVSALRRMLQRAENDLPAQSTRKVLEALLTPMDHLEALTAHLLQAEQLSSHGRQAVEMLDSEWKRAMARLQLEPFDALGLHYDPTRHELIARVSTPGEEDSVVVKQASRGYLLQGRLLRSASVVVNTSARTAVDLADPEP